MHARAPGPAGFDETAVTAEFSGGGEDECDEGTGQCMGETMQRACGKFDDDSCLELGEPTSCRSPSSRTRPISTGSATTATSPTAPSSGVRSPAERGPRARRRSRLLGQIGRHRIVRVAKTGGPTEAVVNNTFAFTLAIDGDTLLWSGDGVWPTKLGTGVTTQLSRRNAGQGLAATRDDVFYAAGDTETGPRAPASHPDLRA